MTAPQEAGPRLEEELVGGVLAWPEVLPDVLELVEPAALSERGPRVTLEAAAALAASGDAVSLIAVEEQLRDAGQLEAAGGAARLRSLVTEARAGSGPAGIVPAARQLARRARQQRTAATLRAALARVERGEGDAVLEVLPAQLAQHAGPAGIPSVSFAEAAREHLEALRKPGAAGHATGVAGLDSRLRGIRPGELVVIAARPRVGKSVLCAQIIPNLARQGVSSAYVSLEMDPGDLAEIALCARSGLHVERLRQDARGDTGTEAERMIVRHLEGLPCRIHNAPRLTVARLVALMRAEHLRHGVQVLAVDNLSLLRDPTVRVGRTWEIASITAQLKATARELGVAVLLVVHLNRQLEHRSGKEGAPRLADLRDSGAIEQDADVVVLLDREDLRAGAEPSDGWEPVEIIAHVAKRRGGRPGRARLWLDPRTLRIVRAPEREAAS